MTNFMYSCLPFLTLLLASFLSLPDFLSLNMSLSENEIEVEGGQTLIVQWNCRSLYQNLNHFRQFIARENPEVICLQSVGRNPRELPFFEGYYFPPYYRVNESNSVYLATYVTSRSKVSLSPSPTPSPDHLALTVKISTAGRELNVTNVYYPNAVPRPNLTKWISDLDTQGKDWLIVGDFNAHHVDWGGDGTISRGGGHHLAQHIIDSDFILLNDGSITRLPHRYGDEPSAIDLSLITPGLRQQTTWHTYTDDLGSDHIPIMISISRAIDKTAKPGDCGFDFEKADWSRFSAKLLSFDPIPAHFSVQEQYDIFVSRVMEVAKETIPFKKHHENKISNPWWNTECAIAVKEKSQAYSAYKKRSNQVTFDEYKKARRNCKRVINEAKTIYWEKFVKEHICDYRDTSKVWKKIRKLKRQYKVPDAALKVNGVKLTSDRDKAEAFCGHLCFCKSILLFT